MLDGSHAADTPSDLHNQRVVYSAGLRNHALFIFNGASEAGAGKRAVVAAFCDAHAAEVPTV
jgi:hypothetical protein